MNDASGPGVGGRLFVALQYALPQHALSGLMYRAARLELGPLTRGAIRLFVHAFGVDLSEAMEPDPAAYPSFNDFFTRPLRPGVRPLDPDPASILSPVDGTVSQIGGVTAGTLLQAKGRGYDVCALFGGDADLAAEFDSGAFATLYLSPRDYHRIHMPVDGVLRETIYVPGRLFSVNATTVAGVPRLFARNERLVCVFDTEIGPMAMVLVGAIFVGSIETVWGARAVPPRGRSIRRDPRPRQPVALARGEEMGRFTMGSTVILVLPKGAAAWRPELGPGIKVVCGTPLGRRTG